MKKFKVFALVFAIMLSATGLGLLFGSSQPASTQAKVSADGTTNATWYNDWTHSTPTASDSTISLTAYNGTETTHTVPATATIDDKVYSVIFGSGSPEIGKAQVSLGTITSLSFEKGVKFPTNSENLFYGSKLTSLNLTGVDTSKVTDMNGMFYCCSSLTGIEFGNNFDTSNVTNMNSMFYGCKLLTSLDLSNFNTNKVTDMSSMFLDCNKLTSLNLSNFDTSKVTKMKSMFWNCGSLTSLNLSNFNTSNVTNMWSMFIDCSSLPSLDLRNFDTSNVTDMPGMFNNCSALLSLDLSKFDTSKVTDMNGMFSGCSSLTSITFGAKFDTSKVTDMRYMFDVCKLLTSLDLSSFATSKVTNMKGMFSGCTSLQNIKMPNTMNKSSTITLNALSLPSQSTSGAAIKWYSLASGAENGTPVVADNKVSTYAGHILTTNPNKSYDAINAETFTPAKPETPSTGVVLDVVLPVASIVLVLASLVAVAFVGKKKKQY